MAVESRHPQWFRCPMMTSSNGNIFLVTGHLCVNSPVNSPHKGQWRGALKFSLICTRMSGWVNNGEAGDLRRHRAHYDVTVMPTGMPGRAWWANDNAGAHLYGPRHMVGRLCQNSIQLCRDIISTNRSKDNMLRSNWIMSRSNWIMSRCNWIVLRYNWIMSRNNFNQSSTDDMSR